MTILIHTADWHLGKTFRGYADDVEVQTRLRLERLDAIDRLGEAARAANAAAVLVAGDVFHTNEVEDRLVLDALARIGRMQVLTIAIPGNHDHAGAGSVWERRAFVQHRDRLAPNLRVVTDAITGIEVGDVTVVASPVLQRFHQVALADLGEVESAEGRPRIGLVHAATLTFAEDQSGRALATQNGERARLDYLALGDFHRQQQVDGLPCPAWYAGALTPDNFASHGQDGERIGTCLRLHVRGNGRVDVEPIALGGVRWLRVARALRDEVGVEQLLQELRAHVGNDVGKIVCEIDLEGSVLGYAAGERWRAASAELRPLFLSLQQRSEIALEPSEDEQNALAMRPGLAGRAATDLRLRIAEGGQEALIARFALLRLYQLAQSTAVRT
ncbi:MAG: metallophosphoesterase [Planctomycetota bacterium]